MREEAKRLRLVAQGHPQLEAWISARLPEAWGPYQRPALLDFGVESLVFSAEDEARGEEVTLKLPFVDYSHPARLDLQGLKRRRVSLSWEIEVLERIGPPFPALIEAFELENPLLPRSLPPRLRLERVPVMERLEGEALAPQARRLARDEAWAELEALLLSFTRASLELAARVEAAYGPQALYADLKLENAARVGQEIRFFDAGSVMTLREGEVIKTTPLYLDPQDWDGGRLKPPEASGPFFRRCLRRCVAVVLAYDNTLPGRPCVLEHEAARRILALVEAEL